MIFSFKNLVSFYFGYIYPYLLEGTTYVISILKTNNLTKDYYPYFETKCGLIATCLIKLATQLEIKYNNHFGTVEDNIRLLNIYKVSLENNGHYKVVSSWKINEPDLTSFLNSKFIERETNDSEKFKWFSVFREKGKEYILQKNISSKDYFSALKADKKAKYLNAFLKSKHSDEQIEITTIINQYSQVSANEECNVNVLLDGQGNFLMNDNYLYLELIDSDINQIKLHHGDVVTF